MSLTHATELMNNRIREVSSEIEYGEEVVVVVKLII